MEPESSLPHSKQSATFPYPEVKDQPCELFRNIVSF